ncbi:MAG: hypothetical protein RSF79_19795, partial [Janthinobacterium sp.]
MRHPAGSRRRGRLMVAWLLGTLPLALLLSAVAWRAERAQHRRGRTTRWLWLAAIAASVLLPLAWLPGVLAAMPPEQAQLKLASQQLQRQQQMAAEEATRQEDVQIAEA